MQQHQTTTQLDLTTTKLDLITTQPDQTTILITTPLSLTTNQPDLITTQPSLITTQPGQIIPLDLITKHQYVYYVVHYLCILLNNCLQVLTYYFSYCIVIIKTPLYPPHCEYSKYSNRCQAIRLVNIFMMWKMYVCVGGRLVWCNHYRICIVSYTWYFYLTRWKQKILVIM